MRPRKDRGPATSLAEIAQPPGGLDEAVSLAVRMLWMAACAPEDPDASTLPGPTSPSLPGGTGGGGSAGTPGSGGTGAGGAGGTGGGTGATGGVGGSTGDGFYDLVVDGGFGGGRYAPGTAHHVWADVDPQTEIATWSGESALLDAPGEWNAGLVLPDHDVVVTADRTPWATAPEARRYDLAGGTRDVLVLTVEAPLGLVLFFHGGAYAVDQLRTNAGIAIAHRLQQAGWVVAALESEAEAAAGVGGWDSDLDDNTDLRNAERLVTALRDDGTVPDGLPVVAWGKSAGGIFAHTVGASGLAETVVAFCAAATDEATDVTQAHTAWFLAENDKTFPSAIADASSAQVVLDGRGLRTDLYVHPTTPLYDQRFERVAGIDPALSASLADRIRDGGFVDDDDAWLVAGTAVDIDLSDVPAEARVAVLAEIEMMAADHELYDDVAARVVAFLDP